MRIQSNQNNNVFCLYYFSAKNFSLHLPLEAGAKAIVCPYDSGAAEDTSALTSSHQ